MAQAGQQAAAVGDLDGKSGAGVQLQQLGATPLLEELELLDELELLAPGFSGSLPEPPPLEQAPSNNVKISINIWLINGKDGLEAFILNPLP